MRIYNIHKCRKIYWIWFNREWADFQCHSIWSSKSSYSDDWLRCVFLLSNCLVKILTQFSVGNSVLEMVKIAGSCQNGNSFCPCNSTYIVQERMFFVLQINCTLEPINQKIGNILLGFWFLIIWAKQI